MGKTLKICLTMGGGVSLGSFSGSALTEALKLLMLYGQDENGKKYDNVVVDGMSGASAGAVALTVGFPENRRDNNSNLLTLNSNCPQ